MNIIQEYAPTADSALEEIGTFLSELTGLVKLAKKHDVNNGRFEC